MKQKLSKKFIPYFNKSIIILNFVIININKLRSGTGGTAGDDENSEHLNEYLEDVNSDVLKNTE